MIKITLISCITLMLLKLYILLSNLENNVKREEAGDENSDKLLKRSPSNPSNDSLYAKWGPDKCDQYFICKLKEPIDEFNADCLREHNILRSKHNVPPLRSSKKLIEIAKRRAIGMAGKNINVYHPKDIPYGENMHQIISAPIAKVMECIVAINAFYKEKDNYDFTTGKSKNKKLIGHFTQLVWKKSQQIGCAQAVYIGTNKYKRAIVVCEYEPFGNIKGTYISNVPPINQ